MKFKFKKGSRQIIIDDEGKGLNKILTTNVRRTDYPFIKFVKNSKIKYFFTIKDGIYFKDGSIQEWNKEEVPIKDFSFNDNIVKFLSSTVKRVGEIGLNECRSLTEIDFPNCTSVGPMAFNYCTSLQYANLPLCETIESSAFKYTNLKKIELPSCVRVGREAFWDCHSLEEVSLPACVEIKYGTFAFCPKLKKMNFPNVANISNGTFFGNSFKEIHLPKVKELRPGVFVKCEVETIYAPSCEILYGDVSSMPENLKKIVVKKGCIIKRQELLTEGVEIIYV